MKYATLLLLISLVSGCAHIIPQGPATGDAEKMLLLGIQNLSKQNSRSTLEKLVKQHPGTPQALAAKQLLATYGKQKPKAGNSAELEKLRSENQRLHEDLEKLRQLLIKSEKRAS